MCGNFLDFLVLQVLLGGYILRKGLSWSFMFMHFLLQFLLWLRIVMLMWKKSCKCSYVGIDIRKECESSVQIMKIYTYMLGRTKDH